MSKAETFSNLLTPDFDFRGFAYFSSGGVGLGDKDKGGEVAVSLLLTGGSSYQLGSQTPSGRSSLPLDLSSPLSQNSRGWSLSSELGVDTTLLDSEGHLRLEDPTSQKKILDELNSQLKEFLEKNEQLKRLTPGSEIYRETIVQFLVSKTLFPLLPPSLQQDILQSKPIGLSGNEATKKVESISWKIGKTSSTRVAHFLKIRGEEYRRKGEEFRAIKCFQEALKLHSTPAVQFELARAKASWGMKEFETKLRRDPSNIAVQEKLRATYEEAIGFLDPLTTNNGSSLNSLQAVAFQLRQELQRRLIGLDSEKGKISFEKSFEEVRNRFVSELVRFKNNVPPKTEAERREAEEAYQVLSLLSPTLERIDRSRPTLEKLETVRLVHQFHAKALEWADHSTPMTGHSLVDWKSSAVEIHKNLKIKLQEEQEKVSESLRELRTELTTRPFGAEPLEVIKVLVRLDREELKDSTDLVLRLQQWKAEIEKSEKDGSSFYSDYLVSNYTRLFGEWGSLRNELRKEGRNEEISFVTQSMEKLGEKIVSLYEGDPRQGAVRNLVDHSIRETESREIVYFLDLNSWKRQISQTKALTSDLQKIKERIDALSKASPAKDSTGIALQKSERLKIQDELLELMERYQRAGEYQQVREVSDLIEDSIASDAPPSERIELHWKRNTAIYGEKLVDEYLQLLGAHVPAFYRDGSGKLDPSKIKEGDLAGFVKSLKEQADYDDHASNIIHSFVKIFENGKYQELEGILFPKKVGEKFEIPTDFAERKEKLFKLLRNFEDDLIDVDPKAFVGLYFSTKESKEGRQGKGNKGNKVDGIGGGSAAGIDFLTGLVEERKLHSSASMVRLVQALADSAEDEKIANQELIDGISEELNWNLLGIWDVKPASWVSEEKLERAAQKGMRILEVHRDHLAKLESERSQWKAEPEKITQLALGITRIEAVEFGKELKSLEGKQDRISKYQKDLLEAITLFADEKQWKDHQKKLGWLFPLIHERTLHELKELYQESKKIQCEDDFVQLTQKADRLFHKGLSLDVFKESSEVLAVENFLSHGRSVEKIFGDLPSSVIQPLTKLIQRNDKLIQLKDMGGILFHNIPLAAEHRYLKDGVERLFKGIPHPPENSSQEKLVDLHEKLNALIQKPNSEGEIDQAIDEWSKEILADKSLSKKEKESLLPAGEIFKQLNKSDRLFCDQIRSTSSAMEELSEELVFGFGQFGYMSQGISLLAKQFNRGDEVDIQRGIQEIERGIRARTQFTTVEEIEKDLKNLHQDFNDKNSLVSQARLAAKMNLVEELVNLAQSSFEVLVLEAIAGPEAALARLNALLKRVETGVAAARGVAKKGIDAATRGARRIFKKEVEAAAKTSAKTAAEGAKTVATKSVAEVADPWSAFERSFGEGLDLKISLGQYAMVGGIVITEGLVRALPNAIFKSLQEAKNNFPAWLEETIPEMMAEGAKGAALTPLDNLLNIAWGELYGKSVRDHKEDGLAEWALAAFATGTSMFLSAPLEGKPAHLHPKTPKVAASTFQGKIKQEISEALKALPGKTGHVVHGTGKETFEESVDQRISVGKVILRNDAARLALVCLGGEAKGAIGGIKDRVVGFFKSGKTDESNLSPEVQSLLGQAYQAYEDLKGKGEDPIILQIIQQEVVDAAEKVRDEAIEAQRRGGGQLSAISSQLLEVDEKGLYDSVDVYGQVKSRLISLREIIPGVESVLDRLGLKSEERDTTKRTLIYLLRQNPLSAEELLYRTTIVVDAIAHTFAQALGDNALENPEILKFKNQLVLQFVFQGLMSKTAVEIQEMVRKWGKFVEQLGSQLRQVFDLILKDQSLSDSTRQAVLHNALKEFIELGSADQEKLDENLQRLAMLAHLLPRIAEAQEAEEKRDPNLIHAVSPVLQFAQKILPISTLTNLSQIIEEQKVKEAKPVVTPSAAAPRRTSRYSFVRQHPVLFTGAVATVTGLGFSGIAWAADRMGMHLNPANIVASATGVLTIGGALLSRVKGFLTERMGVQYESNSSEEERKEGGEEESQGFTKNRESEQNLEERTNELAGDREKFPRVYELEDLVSRHLKARGISDENLISGLSLLMIHYFPSVVQSIEENPETPMTGFENIPWVEVSLDEVLELLEGKNEEFLDNFSEGIASLVEVLANVENFQTEHSEQTLAWLSDMAEKDIIGAIAIGSAAYRENDSRGSEELSSDLHLLEKFYSQTAIIFMNVLPMDEDEWRNAAAYRFAFNHLFADHFHQGCRRGIQSHLSNREVLGSIRNQAESVAQLAKWTTPEALVDSALRDPEGVLLLAQRLQGGVFSALGNKTDFCRSRLNLLIQWDLEAAIHFTLEMIEKPEVYKSWSECFERSLAEAHKRKEDSYQEWLISQVSVRLEEDKALADRLVLVIESIPSLEMWIERFLSGTIETDAATLKRLVDLIESDESVADFLSDSINWEIFLASNLEEWIDAFEDQDSNLELLSEQLQEISDRLAEARGEEVALLDQLKRELFALIRFDLEAALSLAARIEEFRQDEMTAAEFCRRFGTAIAAHLRGSFERETKENPIERTSAQWEKLQTRLASDVQDDAVREAILQTAKNAEERGELESFVETIERFLENPSFRTALSRNPLRRLFFTLGPVEFMKTFGAPLSAMLESVRYGYDETKSTQKPTYFELYQNEIALIAGDGFYLAASEDPEGVLQLLQLLWIWNFYRPADQIRSLKKMLVNLARIDLNRAIEAVDEMQKFGIHHTRDTDLYSRRELYMFEEMLNRWVRDADQGRKIADALEGVLGEIDRFMQEIFAARYERKEGSGDFEMIRPSFNKEGEFISPKSEEGYPADYGVVIYVESDEELELVLKNIKRKGKVWDPELQDENTFLITTDRGDFFVQIQNGKKSSNPSDESGDGPSVVAPLNVIYPAPSDSAEEASSVRIPSRSARPFADQPPTLSLMAGDPHDENKSPTGVNEERGVAVLREGDAVVEEDPMIAEVKRLIGSVTSTAGNPLVNNVEVLESGAVMHPQFEDSAAEKFPAVLITPARIDGTSSLRVRQSIGKKIFEKFKATGCHIEEIQIDEIYLITHPRGERFFIRLGPTEGGTVKKPFDSSNSPLAGVEVLPAGTVALYARERKLKQLRELLYRQAGSQVIGLSRNLARRLLPFENNDPQLGLHSKHETLYFNESGAVFERLEESQSEALSASFTEEEQQEKFYLKKIQDESSGVETTYLWFRYGRADTAHGIVFKLVDDLNPPRPLNPFGSEPGDPNVAHIFLDGKGPIDSSKILLPVEARFATTEEYLSQFTDPLRTSLRNQLGRLNTEEQVSEPDDFSMPPNSRRIARAFVAMSNQLITLLVRYAPDSPNVTSAKALLLQAWTHLIESQPDIALLFVEPFASQLFSLRGNPFHYLRLIHDHFQEDQKILSLLHKVQIAMDQEAAKTIRSPLKRKEGETIGDYLGTLPGSVANTLKDIFVEHLDKTLLGNQADTESIAQVFILALDHLSQELAEKVASAEEFGIFDPAIQVAQAFAGFIRFFTSERDDFHQRLVQTILQRWETSRSSYLQVASELRRLAAMYQEEADLLEDSSFDIESDLRAFEARFPQVLLDEKEEDDPDGNSGNSTPAAPTEGTPPLPSAPPAAVAKGAIPVEEVKSRKGKRKVAEAEASRLRGNPFGGVTKLFASPQAHSPSAENPLFPPIHSPKEDPSSSVQVGAMASGERRADSSRGENSKTLEQRVVMAAASAPSKVESLPSLEQISPRKMASDLTALDHETRREEILKKYLYGLMNAIPDQRKEFYAKLRTLFERESDREPVLRLLRLILSAVPSDFSPLVLEELSELLTELELKALELASPVEEAKVENLVEHALPSNFASSSETGSVAESLSTFPVSAREALLRQMIDQGYSEDPLRSRATPALFASAFYGALNNLLMSLVANPQNRSLLADLEFIFSFLIESEGKFYEEMFHLFVNGFELGENRSCAGFFKTAFQALTSDRQERTYDRFRRILIEIAHKHYEEDERVKLEKLLDNLENKFRRLTLSKSPKDGGNQGGNNSESSSQDAQTEAIPVEDFTNDPKKGRKEARREARRLGGVRFGLGQLFGSAPVDEIIASQVPADSIPPHENPSGSAQTVVHADGTVVEEKVDPKIDRTSMEMAEDPKEGSSSPAVGKVEEVSATGSVPPTAFGRALENFRRSRGLTQLGVANLLGFSDRLYQIYIAGDAFPTLDRLIAICANENLPGFAEQISLFYLDAHPEFKEGAAIEGNQLTVIFDDLLTEERLKTLTPLALFELLKEDLERRLGREKPFTLWEFCQLVGLSDSISNSLRRGDSKSISYKNLAQLAKVTGRDFGYMALVVERRLEQVFKLERRERAEPIGAPQLGTDLSVTRLKDRNTILQERFGARVQAARERLGMNLVQFAELAGMEYQTLSKVESGKGSDQELETLWKILSALRQKQLEGKISLEEILEIYESYFSDILDVENYWGVRGYRVVLPEGFSLDQILEKTLADVILERISSGKAKFSSVSQLIKHLEKELQSNQGIIKRVLKGSLSLLSYQQLQVLADALHLPFSLVYLLAHKEIAELTPLYVADSDSDDLVDASLVREPQLAPLIPFEELRKKLCRPRASSGAILDTIREKLGISGLKEFADKLGITLTRYRSYKLGQVEPPLSVFVKLAELIPSEMRGEIQSLLSEFYLARYPEARELGIVDDQGNIVIDLDQAKVNQDASFSAILRSLRGEQSVQSLAAELELDVSTIDRLERNQLADIDFAYVAAYAKRFGIDLGFLALKAHPELAVYFKVVYRKEESSDPDSGSTPPTSSGDEAPTPPARKPFVSREGIFFEEGESPEEGKAQAREEARQRAYELLGQAETSPPSPLLSKERGERGEVRPRAVFDRRDFGKLHERKRGEAKPSEQAPGFIPPIGSSATTTVHPDGRVSTEEKSPPRRPVQIAQGPEQLSGKALQVPATPSWIQPLQELQKSLGVSNREMANLLGVLIGEHQEILEGKKKVSHEQIARMVKHNPLQGRFGELIEKLYRSCYPEFFQSTEEGVTVLVGLPQGIRLDEFQRLLQSDFSAALRYFLKLNPAIVDQILPSGVRVADASSIEEISYQDLEELAKLLEIDVKILVAVAYPVIGQIFRLTVIPPRPGSGGSSSGNPRAQSGGRSTSRPTSASPSRLSFTDLSGAVDEKGKTLSLAEKRRRALAIFAEEEKDEAPSLVSRTGIGRLFADDRENSSERIPPAVPGAVSIEEEAQEELGGGKAGGHRTVWMGSGPRDRQIPPSREAVLREAQNGMLAKDCLDKFLESAPGRALIAGLKTSTKDEDPREKIVAAAARLEFMAEDNLRLIRPRISDARIPVIIALAVENLNRHCASLQESSPPREVVSSQSTEVDRAKQNLFDEAPANPAVPWIDEDELEEPEESDEAALGSETLKPAVLRIDEDKLKEPAGSDEGVLGSETPSSYRGVGSKPLIQKRANYVNKGKISPPSRFALPWARTLKEAQTLFGVNDGQVARILNVNPELYNEVFIEGNRFPTLAMFRRLIALFEGLDQSESTEEKLAVLQALRAELEILERGVVGVSFRKEGEKSRRHPLLSPVAFKLLGFQKKMDWSYAQMAEAFGMESERVYIACLYGAEGSFSPELLESFVAQMRSREEVDNELLKSIQLEISNLKIVVSIQRSKQPAQAIAHSSTWNEKLKLLMEALGKAPKDAAVLCGVGVSTYYSYQKGFPVPPLRVVIYLIESLSEATECHPALREFCEAYQPGLLGKEGENLLPRWNRSLRALQRAFGFDDRMMANALGISESDLLEFRYRRIPSHRMISHFVRHVRLSQLSAERRARIVDFYLDCFPEVRELKIIDEQNRIVLRSDRIQVQKSWFTGPFQFYSLIVHLVGLRRLSIEELAEKSGIELQRLRSLLKDEKTEATYAELRAIAEQLEVDVSLLAVAAHQELSEIFEIIFEKEEDPGSSSPPSGSTPPTGGSSSKVSDTADSKARVPTIPVIESRHARQTGQAARARFTDPFQRRGMSQLFVSRRGSENSSPNSSQTPTVLPTSSGARQYLGGGRADEGKPVVMPGSLDQIDQASDWTRRMAMAGGNGSTSSEDIFSKLQKDLYAYFRGERNWSEDEIKEKIINYIRQAEDPTFAVQTLVEQAIRDKVSNFELIGAIILDAIETDSRILIDLTQSLTPHFSSVATPFSLPVFRFWLRVEERIAELPPTSDRKIAEKKEGIASACARYLIDANPLIQIAAAEFMMGVKKYREQAIQKLHSFLEEKRGSQNDQLIEEALFALARGGEITSISCLSLLLTDPRRIIYSLQKIIEEDRFSPRVRLAAFRSLRIVGEKEATEGVREKWVDRFAPDWNQISQARGDLSEEKGLLTLLAFEVYYECSMKPRMKSPQQMEEEAKELHQALYFFAGRLRDSFLTKEEKLALRVEVVRSFAAMGFAEEGLHLLKKVRRELTEKAFLRICFESGLDTSLDGEDSSLSGKAFEQAVADLQRADPQKRIEAMILLSHHGLLSPIMIRYIRDEVWEVRAVALQATQSFRAYAECDELRELQAHFEPAGVALTSSPFNRRGKVQQWDESVHVFVAQNPETADFFSAFPPHLARLILEHLSDDESLSPKERLILAYREVFRQMMQRLVFNLSYLQSMVVGGHAVLYELLGGETELGSRAFTEDPLWFVRRDILELLREVPSFFQALTKGENPFIQQMQGRVFTDPFFREAYALVRSEIGQLPSSAEMGIGKIPKLIAADGVPVELVDEPSGPKEDKVYPFCDLKEYHEKISAIFKDLDVDEVSSSEVEDPIQRGRRLGELTVTCLQRYQQVKGNDLEVEVKFRETLLKVHELIELAFAHFDFETVDIFLESIEPIRQIYENALRVSSKQTFLQRSDVTAARELPGASLVPTTDLERDTVLRQIYTKGNHLQPSLQRAIQILADPNQIGYAFLALINNHFSTIQTNATMLGKEGLEEFLDHPTDNEDEFDQETRKDIFKAFEWIGKLAILFENRNNPKYGPIVSFLLYHEGDGQGRGLHRPVYKLVGKEKVLDPSQTNYRKLLEVLKMIPEHHRQRDRLYFPSIEELPAP